MGNTDMETVPKRQRTEKDVLKVDMVARGQSPSDENTDVSPTVDDTKSETWKKIYAEVEEEEEVLSAEEKDAIAFQKMLDYLP